MDWVVGSELVLICLLLALSAFFSSAETSLFSLTRSQLDQMRLDGNPRAPLVEGLLNQPRRLIVTILIGNEFVNVTASALAASLVIRWAGPNREWVNLVIMVPLLLLAGEITPKTLAIRNNIAFATVQAPLVQRFAVLITPLRWAVRRIADRFITLLVGPERSRASIVTEDMVRSLAREAVGQGELDEREARYIEHIFDFGDTTVRQAMTPRSRIFFLSADTPREEVADHIRRTRHAKIPVFVGEPDNIVGILFARDLLGLGCPTGGPISTPTDLTEVLRPAYFIPETRSAADLFHTFRRKRISIALTLDEYGGVTGLVTMEDLLECIFGEIPSRSDTAAGNEPRWETLGPQRFRTDGRLPLERLSEEVGERVEAGDAETVGGFLLQRCGELPSPGTRVVEGRLAFTVERVEQRQIAAVLVVVGPDTENHTEENPPPSADGADPCGGEGR
ncbi:MAG TPA: hemolysin family protein [Deferrisomatales bacterium]|nr:hemolysin family protein [Deferrisomatales bacterium]